LNLLRIVCMSARALSPRKKAWPSRNRYTLMGRYKACVTKVFVIVVPSFWPSTDASQAGAFSARTQLRRVQ